VRVALYHPWVYLRGGAERTILELLTRSRHRWTLFTSRFQPDDTFPEFRELEVVQVGQVSVRRSLLPVARACLELALMREDWRRFDALMVSCDGIGSLVTLRAPTMPLFCLCHTPLKVAYDTETRQRWLTLMRPGLATRAAVRLFVALDRRLWHRYQRVFCVSREVERRLLRAGLVEPGRTEVVHPGVDMERLRPSGRREPFFLLPGRIMWTKNIELALRAFLRLKAQLGPVAEEFRLVVAGMVDRKSAPYLRWLQQSVSGREDVAFVASPTDAELFDLYDRSYAVLFTPPNEDWGIVPLEAMAFGKPVVAVASGGPLESVADGETSFLCPPTPDDFAAAMARLILSREMYGKMSAAAHRRAGLFTWERFTERIDSYLDSLEEQRGKGLPVRVAR